MVHQLVKVTKAMVQFPKVIAVQFPEVIAKVQNTKHSIALGVAQGLGHMIQEEKDAQNIHNEDIAAKIHVDVAKIVFEGVQHQETIDAEANHRNDDEITIGQEN